MADGGRVGAWVLAWPQVEQSGRSICFWFGALCGKTAGPALFSGKKMEELESIIKNL